jgi:drug/metabolite transporter (DMT)-like permease
MPDASPRAEGVDAAKLLLLLLSLAWGINWPVMKIALNEVSPWTLRIFGYGLGMVFLFALVKLRGRPLTLAFGPAWGHVLVSATLNVIGFGLFSAFAQLSTLTSRVVILSYSMPIWASLLAWLILGERLNVMSMAGLVLCVLGLTVLIYPLAELGVPLGLLLAVAAALSWAAGTVYLKWARMQADVITVTAWQILIAFLVIAACIPLFEETTHLSSISWAAVFALVYQGVIGTGVAYFLWFSIVRRVPAATASLGSLCVPVVGILSSMLILGDRPSLADAIGFTLIFAAAACVLLQPSGRAT